MKIMSNTTNDIEGDGVLESFLSTHGKIQVHNFLIYGKPINEELDLLVKGLCVQLNLMDLLKKDICVFTENIDEEKAVAYKLFQGTLVTFAFTELEDLTPVVQTVIEDGLLFLRYKNEYLGSVLRTCDV